MLRQSIFLLFFFTSQLIYGQPTKISAWPRAVTYEIFVQSFADSNGDGIGDIKGMTSKLDYLKELGIEGVWLMPINPSPSYHKYDVTDYYNIHPDYGTIDDFKTFIKEAHSRGIHVVMDMVLNHSSSKHPWFIDAKTNENSPYRDYYVWTDKDDPQTKAPVKKISGDSDNSRHWNKVDGSDNLYYSYFGGNMPDLNFDNPKLRKEVFKIGQYWLKDIGVDGFRLDAARHIFPDERAADNHNWWIYFRQEMQKVKNDAYIIGEVWAPAEVVGPYLKGIPALFDFDLGFAITKAVNEQQADSLAIKLAKIREFYQSVNPEFIDAIFLTNHDQNRIMSMLGNDLNKAKMAAAILLTLPGSPYLYYGEEIGMTGKKPDQYIREPFLWDVFSKDKSRTSWIKPRYSTDSTVAAESQQINNKASLLNHYKSLIALRNSNKALTYGELRSVSTSFKQVAIFERFTTDQSLLVIHNVSSSPVSISLADELQGYKQIIFKTNQAMLKDRMLQLPAYSTLVLAK